MIVPGDVPHEMATFRRNDEHRSERLLRQHGAAPLPTGATADPAALFVAAVRELVREAPAPTGALVSLLNDGFAPGATGTALRTVTGSADGHRRPRAGWLVAGAAAAMALLSVGTVAHAGVLPDAVQEPLSEVLEAVTPFDFPTGTPVAPGPAPAPQPPRTEPPVSVPPVAQLPEVPTPLPPARPNPVPVPVPVPVVPVPAERRPQPPGPAVDPPAAPRQAPERPAPPADTPPRPAPAQDSADRSGSTRAQAGRPADHVSQLEAPARPDPGR